jgi:DNA-binding CsgD family transcriptional regulator
MMALQPSSSVVTYGLFISNTLKCALSSICVIFTIKAIPSSRFLRYDLPMPDNSLHNQIATLVAQGLDFPEVADCLGCDSKTVSNVIRNHYPHLRKDPGRDDDIRREYRAGKTQRELAEKYGLSKSQIWGICRKNCTA